jgi:mono/diheme cytochrome c family protein
MKKSILVSVVAGVLIAGAVTTSVAAGGKQQQIARGEYLVKGVGQCADCHTPFSDKGEPVMDKWLQGSKLTFAPTIPMLVWADTSPNIAGLAGWDDQQAVKFLMTGIAPNGQPARPPNAAVQADQGGC